ncbi:PKD domain protein, partial [Candidatus Magnetomorum sp. HK-1]
VLTRKDIKGDGLYYVKAYADNYSPFDGRKSNKYFSVYFGVTKNLSPIVLEEIQSKTFALSLPSVIYSDNIKRDGMIGIHDMDKMEQDFIVHFRSSDPSVLEVPEQVLFEANEVTTPFYMHTQEDCIIGESKRITITAFADNWINGVGTVDVVNKTPVPNFYYDIDGATVSFRDDSVDLDTGYIVQWYWDFGDGEYSDEIDPKHIFQNAVSHWVTLSVTDNNGLTKSRSKQVLPGRDINIDDLSSSEEQLIFSEQYRTCSSSSSISIFNTNISQLAYFSIKFISGDQDAFHFSLRNNLTIDRFGVGKNDKKTVYITFESQQSGNKIAKYEISSNLSSNKKMLILSGVSKNKLCNDNNSCTKDYFDNCMCYYDAIDFGPKYECVKGKGVLHSCDKGDPCYTYPRNNTTGECLSPVKKQACLPPIINHDPTYIQYPLSTGNPEEDLIDNIFSPASSSPQNNLLELKYSIEKSSIISIIIYNNDGEVIRTIIQNEKRNAGSQVEIWDGFDETGRPVLDGSYKCIINGVNIKNALDYWTISDKIVVDNMLPVAEISVIQTDTPKYDYYTISGTAWDDNFKSYYLECLNQDYHVYVDFKYVSIKEGILGIFDSSNLPDGDYQLRLTVKDRAGNQSIKEKQLIIDRNYSIPKLHINSVTRESNLANDGYVNSNDNNNVWIDDYLPIGSSSLGEWVWDTGMVYTGLKSHTGPQKPGKSVHYFIHADEPLTLSSGENVIQYVYLDPEYTPKELMLQFYTDSGNGEHRAYWGGNHIVTDSASGYYSLYRMGDIPASGKWVRLKIPASTLNLSNKSIKGLAFITYDGRAWWDKTTKSSNFNETQKSTWLIASNASDDDASKTIVNYTLSKDVYLTLVIYDSRQSPIKTLINEYMRAGTYQVAWDGTDIKNNQVNFAKYYMQFSSPNVSLDSNSYAWFSDFALPDSISISKTVSDSQGYTFQIINSEIQKINSKGDILLTITAKSIGENSLTPASLTIDENDNLYIVDTHQQKVYKLNQYGYLVSVLPSSTTTWGEKDLSILQPVGSKIDQEGDLIIGNKINSEYMELSPGCLVIEHSNIIAEIRVPYENSLVYATVPIFGTATARDFHSYIVEYGSGEFPSQWSTLSISKNKVYDDYKPIPPALTIFGNLASWDTYPPLPKGVYTIRLTVYDNNGNSFNDTVTVNVATLIERWGGTVLSNDGLVQLSIPRSAIASDADLFCINEMKNDKAPAVDDPELTQIGKIYHFLPANYKFLSTCTLKMFYTDEQLGDIEEDTLKIYRWNPIIQRWIYVFADIDEENNVLTTTLDSFNNYVVYYAVISDPPPAPFIYPPPPITNVKHITLFGQATPSVSVEFFVNGLSQGKTIADENSGSFVITGVELAEGDNAITAIAADPVGNASDPSEQVNVQFVIAQPLSVTQLNFKTQDFAENTQEPVAIGETLYIELVGTDASTNSADSSTVTLISHSDNNGIVVQLIETDINTGIYRGMTKVIAAEDQNTNGIRVSSTQIETITVQSQVDSSITDSIKTADLIPPSAPSISSLTHPSLCQDTFEADMGQWQNMSNSYGATVSKTTELAQSGLYAVQMSNTEDGGDFANFVRNKPFDARQFPVISFDYNIPSNVKLNLVALVNDMWKEIVFTDDPKTVETFEDDLYRPIGTIENVMQDSSWHHVEFNLYNMLKNDDPNQSEYIVKELFFVDYNLPGWMELKMGNENPEGATWYVDNFIITEGGQSNNNPVFIINPKDASVLAYSYRLDQKTDTLPDTVSEGTSCTITYQNVDDGVWYFHIRSLDAGGNWGPANHYWLKIDANAPVVDLPEPVNGTTSGSLEISVRITDGNGSGVDPDTIKIKIKDVVYDMDSGGLYYDEKSSRLTFSLWKVSPVPEPWLDGETIHASIIEVKDFSGNALQKPYSWQWVVDYSQMAGGYLSLLTTQGGFTPTWSYDGSRIAFMSSRSGNEDIWIIQADDYAERNGTTRQLTNHEANDHHPAWSPVSDRIAFVSDRDGTDHIYIIKADGTELNQITFGDVDDSHPTWNESGSIIAFSKDGEIWNVNMDGSNETQITVDSVEYYIDPSWSPEGNLLAFTRSLYVDEVALIDTKGANLNILTQSGKDMLPAWSKKTEHVIFVTKRDDITRSLRVVSTSGANEASYIESNQWWDTEPEESPNGGNIAIQSTRNGTWNIWVKTQLYMTGVSASPEIFSPNADGISDLVDIRFKLMSGASNVDIHIYDASNQLIKTIWDQHYAEKGENIVQWDGTNDSEEIVPDGDYTYKISILATVGSENIEKSGVIKVDNQPPEFSEWIIPEPSEDQIHISTILSDSSGVTPGVTKLQYGISSTDSEISPDIISWNDFGSNLEGDLSLGWSNYDQHYLYVRAYSEDQQGNAGYSDIQKRVIQKSISPPVISEIPDKTIDEDTISSPIQFTITDADTASDFISISITYDNQALLSSDSIAFTRADYLTTLIIQPTANQNGLVQLTVIADDGNITTTENFSLTVTPVNDPPVLYEIDNQTMTMNANSSPIHFTVYDIDEDDLQFTISTNNDRLLPAGSITTSLTATTGTLFITPATNETGAATITVNVNDGTLTKTTSFSLTVVRIEQPSISAIEDQIIEEDTVSQPISLSLTGFIDSEPEVLAKSSNSDMVPSENISLTGTGFIHSLIITPSQNMNGSAMITLLATGDGFTVTTSFALTVTAINDPPVIENIADISLYENSASESIKLTVSDIDSDNLNVVATSNNSDLIPDEHIALTHTNNEWLLTITPMENQSGTAKIMLTVSDGSLTDTTAFNLTVTEVNDPPEIMNISDITIAEDSVTEAIKLTVSDIDSYTLSVVASSNNHELLPDESIAINFTNNEWTLFAKPVENQFGEATILLTVNDDGSLTDTTSFTLIVTEVNDPPEIADIS